MLIFALIFEVIGYIYINISTSIATVQTHTDFKTAYLQGYVHGVGIFVNLEIPLIIDSIE